MFAVNVPMWLALLLFDSLQQTAWCEKEPKQLENAPVYCCFFFCLESRPNEANYRCGSTLRKHITTVLPHTVDLFSVEQQQLRPLTQNYSLYLNIRVADVCSSGEVRLDRREKFAYHSHILWCFCHLAFSVTKCISPNSLICKDLQQWGCLWRNCAIL